MTAIAIQLEILIDEYMQHLNAISQDEFTYKTSPVKWSNKELMGHLIDSAENNIRRFIVAQYEENPIIMYNQDMWVAINNYQQWYPTDLIQLWYLLNRKIIFILKNTPPEMIQRICNSQAAYTIEWLAKDYITHLKHHMHQVLNLEIVAYP